MPEAQAAPASLADRVRALAGALGFDRAGIARLDTPLPHADRFRDWLARGRHGEMAWLARNPEERLDPLRRFPWARSAVVVSLVYDTPREAPERAPAQDRAPGRRPAGEAAGSSPPSAGIARYARGRDYHDILLPPLRALGDALEPLAGRAVQSRAYVDTGPLLERALAARAGLGWIGRNTLVIDPALGSYLFLGVLLCDLDLPGDPLEPDHCGSCRACLDACPTGAFPEPYVLDASRCLSYTTIELRSAIPEPLRAGQGDWVFGCDACQEVCPWNTRTRRTVPPDRAGLRAALAPRAEWVRPALAWLLALDEEAWRVSTRRGALRRAKHRGLLRNALVAAGNAGDPALASLVARHAASPDPLIAEHARWALARLQPQAGRAPS
ncbi:MAG: tRNA epoxyqueuosine(34) reductase QueG [Deltaproteobacteria bacterium]|nr:tRNA epoxyqueuosine(34) reductase QueG [Deltaproteobacteria bacterium]